MPKSRVSKQQSLKVLQLIRSSGAIARSEVAVKTGDSPFLTSKICDELLEAGFISEAGFGDSTGGRRPTLLSLRPDLGRLIGIHLGTVNARIALTDFKGNLIGYLKDKSHASEGPEAAMAHLFELVDSLMAGHKVRHADLNGIGVGISAVLERTTGTTLYWPKLSRWDNVPIRKILEDRYRVEVALEDTSRTSALAEYWLGGCSTAKHFIFIGIGAGIGAALFLNGALYEGVGGFAGEFGHVSVAPNAALCSCGNRGCLETVASASALLRKARQGLSLGLSDILMRIAQGKDQSITLEMLAQAADEGDRFTARLLSELGGYIGQGIVTLVNLLNPELIVLGGGVASAVGGLILPEIQRVVRDNAMIQSVKQVQFRLSNLQEKDWALGAMMLVAEKALANSFMKATKATRGRP
jgi:N-acetylglucosamine repressor